MTPSKRIENRKLKPQVWQEPWQDPSQQPYIIVENVSKSFDGAIAVNHVNLSIYKGEFFSILGPSGCGKTTLLRMLSGFEMPDYGHILIDGVDVTHLPPYKRPVNMMFQSYALFPHMTVESNVAFGLRQESVPKEELQERVASVLQLVRMTSFANRKPHQLSGGQRQRVALARSLAKRPKLVLLDEPLGALDKVLREETQFELVNIQEEVGITFIMVTHDQEEAMTMSSRMAIMEEGRTRQIATPQEIYEYPNSRYVADFFGTMNIFDGIVQEDSPDHVIISCPELKTDLYISYSAAVPIGAKVAVALRPEKVFMLKEKPPAASYNSVKGIVREIGYLGDVSTYHVALESGKRILATTPNLVRLSERPINWDDEVYLHWRPESGVILLS